MGKIYITVFILLMKAIIYALDDLEFAVCTFIYVARL